MPVNYYELGPNKRLNQIVIAGSHDAGITSGHSFAKTQDRTIGEQAACGVRVFDLRIAAAAAGGGGAEPKRVELTTYHGALNSLTDRTREVVGLRPDGAGNAPSATLTRSTAKPGTAFGEGLADILRQARNFVNSSLGKTEFLILKFDKCQNPGLIAQACVEIVGGALLKGKVNLNTATLEQLRGKVIVVFSEAELAEMNYQYGHLQGILRFANLAGGAAYQHDFGGLQYWGKGGTRVYNPVLKVEENVSTQRARMRDAVNVGNPQIMGMLYWTTTGIFGDIEQRNADMWSDRNLRRFHKLWQAGLGDYLLHNLPLPAADGTIVQGTMRKRFMPNIVMVDFADAHRCDTVRRLNDLTPEQLAAMA